VFALSLISWLFLKIFMKNISIMILVLSICMFFSYDDVKKNQTDASDIVEIKVSPFKSKKEQSPVATEVIEGLKKIASTQKFKVYDGNPILTCSKETWDAGALGSMSVLLVSGQTCKPKQIINS
jgi:hypothetical protein